MHRLLLSLLVLCLLATTCAPGATPTPDAVARQMAINTRLAQQRTTAGPGSSGTPAPGASPSPLSTGAPGPSTAPAPSPSPTLEPDPLPHVSLAGNKLENGDFEGLAGWEDAHSSPVPDRTRLAHGGNFVFWQRVGSQENGGSLGVAQSLDLDVSEARRVELCLDIWVGYHTLKNTGWFAEEYGRLNEMPVHVRIDYLDEAGLQQTWHHGFLTRHDGTTSMSNYTLVPAAKWRYFCFDILDDQVRRGPYGRETLPQPIEIQRVQLFGNGWDFKGAVGNVMLRVD